MGIATPVALWGLLALGALILLSFWRLRPERVVVPSLALWRRLPDRVPPVRSLRRPLVSASLLAQIAAVACGVVGLAGPFLEKSGLKRRAHAIVIDLSARMHGRLDAAREQYGNIRRGLEEGARVDVWTFPPVRRGEPVWEAAHVAGDPALALELAARDADVVWFVGDRPVAAKCRQALVGGPSQNRGFIDAYVEGGVLYARILEPAGERVAMFEPQEEIRLQPDAFPLDDVLYLDRRAAPVEVALEGRPDAAIRRALERLPHVRLVKGGRPSIVVRVGEPARADDPPARVIVDAPGGAAVEGAIEVRPHALTASVHVDDLVLRDLREVEGVPLVTVGGRTIAAVRGREVVIGASIPPDGWPLRPSFPIFWSNVIEFLPESKGQEWLVRRTREPVELADGRTVTDLRVGPNRFGGEVVSANLLDRAASDLAGEARPLGQHLHSGEMESRRRDVSDRFAILALVFVLLSWWLERKAR